MSVYRGVFFFRSGNDNIIYACRAHRGIFNTDKHVDNLKLSECGITVNSKGELLRLTDTRTGNVYIPHPSCKKIQD